MPTPPLLPPDGSPPERSTPNPPPVEFEVLPPGQSWNPQPVETKPSGQWKKYFGPLIFIGVLLLKFGSKIKFLIAPALKFIPAVLKTGSTMLITIGVYATMWGWK